MHVLFAAGPNSIEDAQLGAGGAIFAILAVFAFVWSLSGSGGSKVKRTARQTTGGVGGGIFVIIAIALVAMSGAGSDSEAPQQRTPTKVSTPHTKPATPKEVKSKRPCPEGAIICWD